MSARSNGMETSTITIQDSISTQCGDSSPNIISQPMEALGLQQDGTMHNTSVVSTKGFLPQAVPAVEADSGYSSADVTTGEETPRTLHDGFPADSENFPRKVTKLQVFNQEIPELVKNRFKDLVELFSKPLYDFVYRNQKGLIAISIRLVVLGGTDTNAKPRIVVMCDKDVMKRVKNFFKQPSVKSEFLGNTRDPSLPQLDIVFYDRPPRQMAATSAVDVYGSMKNINTLTSCGIPIRVFHPNGPQFATLGGIVKVVTPLGRCMLYGMTAGHVMANHEADSGTDKLDVEDDTASEDGGYVTEEDDYFELDNPAAGEHYIATIPSPEETPPLTEELDIIDVQWDIIGHTFATCRETEEEPNFDWALIHLDDKSLYRPNRFVDTRTNSDPEESEKFDNSLQATEGNQLLLDRCVVVLSGSSSYNTGILSGHSSFLMMSPGKRFVETFILTLDDQNGNSPSQIIYGSNLVYATALKPGHCGSWVVDISTREVYGHVIASDALGQAYIIPLPATMNDIQEQLKAKNVKLLTWPDICHIHNQTVMHLQEILSTYHIHSQTVLHKEETLSTPTFYKTISSEFKQNR